MYVLTVLPADVGQEATSASLAEAEALLFRALFGGALSRCTGDCLRVDVAFPHQLHSTPRASLGLP